MRAVTVCGRGESMSPDSSRASASHAESFTVANTPRSDVALRGSVLVLIQFDVAEEIRLDALRELLGVRTIRQPSLKQAVPGYVRYQRPPVVEPIEPLVLETGER